MEEWKEYKLRDVLTIKYGKDHKQIADGVIPIYGSGGIMRYGERSLYEGPSILIPRKGSLNNIMYSDKPFWTVDTMFWTIINEEIANPLFVYYSICKKDFASLNVGSAVPSLTVPVIEDVDILLPSKFSQDKIVAILKSLDDKIEVNRRINENLEQQAQALFKSWFVDFEPFKDGEFVESELGMIPKGCSVKKLMNICTIKYGKGISKNELVNEGFPVFGGNGIIGFHEKYLYELPQILVSCRGAASGKIMESYPMSFVTSNSLVLELFNRLYYNYLKCYLMRNPLYDYATGSAQPQITIDNIKNVPILIPSEGVLEHVDYLFESIYKKQWELIQESGDLAELRDTLLPKLMSGELRVSDIDI